MPVYLSILLTPPSIHPAKRTLLSPPHKDSAEELLKQHPLGSTDDEGDPFWTGVRRPPSPLKLDSANLLHREFVWWASVLRAGVYGVEVPRLV